MGGFYGAIHVRTSQRETVQTAMDEVTKMHGIKCLVGPVLGAWVSIYPENSGQDSRISAALARKIDDTILHLMVHDDDVLAYWLYHEGKPVDSYWSLPGYFGEQHRAAEEAMCGQPNVLAEHAGGTIELIQQLLDRDPPDRPHFASERLEKLAKVLTISNAVTSFESLMEGERHGIKGWRQFMTLPADVVQQERLARRQHAAAIRRAKQSLKKQGILIEEFAGKPTTHTNWCVVGNDVWMITSDWFSAAPASVIEVYTADRPNGEPARFSITESVLGSVASPTSSSVALNLVRRSGQSLHAMIGVWDVARKSFAWQFEFRGRPAGFDRAGERLLVINDDEVSVLSVTDGGVLASLQWDRGSHHAIIGACFVPSGSSVLLNEQTRLFVVDTQLPEKETPIYVGGKFNLAFLYLPRAPGVDVEIAEMRAYLDHEYELETQCRMPEEEMEQLLAPMRKGISLPPESRTLTEPVTAKAKPSCILFGSTDDWVFFGTNKGLYVYRWQELLAEGDPVWEFASGRRYPNGSLMRDVVTIAEDASRGEVVFAGVDGLVRAMDLQTGATTTVLKFPERLRIFEIGLSRDGQRLCVSGVPDDELASAKRNETRVSQLWNYSKLREQAVVDK